MSKKVIGIDFGTLSARAVIIDSLSGAELGTGVANYRHGVLSDSLPSGKKLAPCTAYHLPADYTAALHESIAIALKDAKLCAKDISGIGLDFTCSTLLSLGKDMRPLCEDPEFENEPEAYMLLWKHNAAQKQTERMVKIASERAEKWLKAYGNKHSSEWFFPKILYILENSPKVYENTARFMEAADWITYLLTENEAKSSSIAAFKALWDKDLGFPDNEFFKALDPRLDGIIGTKVSDSVFLPESTLGHITKEGALISGLCEGTPVAMPIIDAHAPLAALGITGKNELMIVMGTSGCHIINAEGKKCIGGINGYGDCATFPSLCTYEAGQSSFGDCLDWFIKTSVPESYKEKAEKQGLNLHEYLSSLAALQAPGQSGLLALDWLSGSRSVYYNSKLSGMVLGITTSTKPEEIYRAFIEAIAYGTKRIIEEFEQNGIPVNKICATGGIAHKNPLLLQIFADVTERDISVSGSAQAAAYGSAVTASVAAGIYTDIFEAVKALKKPVVKTYSPITANSKKYARLYEQYIRLYRYFGSGENDVMEVLSDIKKENYDG